MRERSPCGVSLDTGDVLLRRAEGGPELHIVGATEELLVHLMAAGENPPPTTAPSRSLRVPGVLAPMSAIELDGTGARAEHA
jgi:hypothetical protein